MRAPNSANVDKTLAPMRIAWLSSTGETKALQ